MARVFATNEFYHTYNRGVDKRKIFMDKSDYIRFVHDLYEFNDINPALQFSRRKNVGFRKPNIETQQEPNIETRKTRREPLVNLHAFVAMPNHHHELIEQLVDGGISLFMKKVHAGYANAFNLKHKRGGHLFQGAFKDVYVENDTQLAHLVCYIHANPLNLWKPGWKETNLKPLEIQQALKFLEKYRWSSHLDYMGIKNFPSLINNEFLLEFFGGIKGYKEFFIDWLKQYQNNVDSIQDLILES